MNILSANNYHHIRGGSDRVFFNTGDLLQAAGHRVVPFAAASPADEPAAVGAAFPRGADTAAPRIRDFGRFLHNAEAARALAALVAAEGPFDLAHLHIYYGRLTPAILPPLRRAGIPIVQTLHEYKLACPVYTLERDGRPCRDCVGGSALHVLRHRCKDGSALRSAVMLAEFWSSRLQGDVRLIDRFICVSDFQLAVMRRAGLPAGKLTRLHNFVDTATFRPCDAADRGDYYLYYGRIERLKGVPTLIEAMRRTDGRVMIAGDGQWRPEMERRIAGDARFDFRGFLSGAALREAIAGAKAVIVPSEWYENCPMSVIEAKASGTPVIGARIGGIPELVRDGIDGVLFEPGDADGLAAAIAKVEAADRTAMGQAARADAEARFAPGVHLDGLLAIYGEAIAARGRAA